MAGITDHIISHIKEAKGSTVKPVTSIFVYAVRIAEDGDARLLDEFLLAGRRFPQNSNWVRHRIGPVIRRMLSEENSEVCKQAIVRALPCLEGAWFHVEDKARFVERWLSAAASLKYTQEIGQAVVEVLLRMVCSYEWRRHVTPAAWNWLKRRPQLPPVSWARQGCCSNPSAISEIQALNNPELLTAYLIVVWSEWDWLAPWVCDYMCTVIRKNFGGEGMKGHREELHRRLSSVQEQLDLGLGPLREHGSKMSGDHFEPTKETYGALMKTLQEMESSSPAPAPYGTLRIILPPTPTSPP